MQVVILRRNLFKERSAEHADQRLEFAVAKAIQFLRAKDGVKLSVGPRCQIQLVCGKYFQAAQPNIAGQQLIQRQCAGGRKSKCMVQQRRTHF